VSGPEIRIVGGTVADYGMASSPLVLSDLVIVTAGAPKATVTAYRVKNGELAWKAGDDPAGYSSPALLDVAGRKQLVAFTGGSVLGLMPETGAVLWRYPYETDFECNIAAPLAYEGQVFVSSGENHGCVLLKLKPAGDKLSVQEVWQSQGKDSVLRNEWQTSIQLGGYLYGFDKLSDDKRKIVFLCEGPFDAIALDYHLKTNRPKYDILAVPGSGFKEQWVEHFSGRKVRVMFDNDKSGEEQSKRVQKLLGESGVAQELQALK
jgi:5S rRNA maturation endonuclease (ribonuclease M5)